jgi:hypothetical protein
MKKLLAFFIVTAALCAAQTPAKETPEPPIPMPSDRAADSSLIYAQLLPKPEYLADTTAVMVQPDESCIPASAAATTDMNPHHAIRPPASRVQEFAEVLADFDSHCHEQIQLTNDMWPQNGQPYLLNQAEIAKRVKEGLRGVALYSVSEVFFNAHHTLAMVYTGHHCGMRCGRGGWVIFEVQNGQWKSLPWDGDSVVS